MSSGPAHVAHRWFDEVWNQGLEKAIDEMLSPDVIGFGLGEEGNPTRGSDAFKVFWRNIRTALPDIHMTIEDTIAQGDKVVVRFSMAGTHQGAGLGVAPSGRSVSISGIAIIRERDGKIVEAWNSWDQLGLLQQTGAVSAHHPEDRFLSAQV